MAAINLGGFSVVGGKTVASGMSSGLDTEALVNAAVDAKKIPITRLEDKQTLSSNKISAYATLQSLLSTLKTSMDFLRNPPSLISSTTNLFTYRKAYITSNTAVAGNTYVGITAEPNSQSGKFTLEDIVLAKARTIRSNSFTSKTTSVTDAAGTNNPGKFSAGTFQITSGTNRATISRVSSDTLDASEIIASGTTGSSVLNSAFGTNGLIMASGGDFDLIGTVSDTLTSSSATQTGTAGDGSDITLNITINGVTYSSAPIAANTGVGNNEIAANTTIVLSNATTGASFQIQTGGAIAITSQTDLNNFASNVANDLKPITFSQSRELGNFDVSKTTGTTLDGLTSANVKLTSDSFNISNDTHGRMGAFSVTAASAPGAGDGTIQVTIDGEVYQATGLGDGSDQITGNVTLTSSSGKTLALNFGDAGVALDISSAGNALAIERDLNKAFGVSTEITINEGDSLTDIAATINAQKNVTGVSATIIQVSSNDFRLYIQSEQAGIENAFNIVDVDDVFASTVTFNETQAAQDASFTLNGLSITRSTNTINDVIPGVTFTLFQDSPLNTEVSVEIAKDTDSAKDAIINFLNAYNAFRAFVGEQRERDDNGRLVETAVIGSDTTLQTAISRMENELNGFVTALSAGDPSRLADIGITFTDFPGDDETPPTTNILQLDQDKLDKALANNFDAVRRIFEFTFTSSSSTLQAYTRTNALGVNNFSVDIDITRATGDKVRVTYTDPKTGILTTINADFSASSTGTGGTITGQKGTVLEGLKMLYTGDGTDIITVNTSQGLADRLYNTIGAFTDSGGLIDTEVNSLKSQNDRMQNDIDKLNEQIETFRERLLRQYAALEETITRANSLLQLLEAQLNVMYAQNR